MIVKKLTQRATVLKRGEISSLPVSCDVKTVGEIQKRLT